MSVKKAVVSRKATNGKFASKGDSKSSSFATRHPQVDEIGIFVRDFYKKNGKAMTKLAYE